MEEAVILNFVNWVNLSSNVIGASSIRTKILMNKIDCSQKGKNTKIVIKEWHAVTCLGVCCGRYSNIVCNQHSKRNKFSAMSNAVIKL